MCGSRAILGQRRIIQYFDATFVFLRQFNYQQKMYKTFWNLEKTQSNGSSVLDQLKHVKVPALQLFSMNKVEFKMQNPKFIHTTAQLSESSYPQGKSMDIQQTEKIQNKSQASTQYGDQFQQCYIITGPIKIQNHTLDVSFRQHKPQEINKNLNLQKKQRLAQEKKTRNQYPALLSRIVFNETVKFDETQQNSKDKPQSQLDRSLLSPIGLKKTMVSPRISRQIQQNTINQIKKSFQIFAKESSINDSACNQFNIFKLEEIFQIKSVHAQKQQKNSQAVQTICDKKQEKTLNVSPRLIIVPKMGHGTTRSFSQDSQAMTDNFSTFKQQNKYGKKHQKNDLTDAINTAGLNQIRTQLVKIEANPTTNIEKGSGFHREDTLRGVNTNNITMGGSMVGSMLDNNSPQRNSTIKTEAFDSPNRPVLKFAKQRISEDKQKKQINKENKCQVTGAHFKFGEIGLCLLAAQKARTEMVEQYLINNGFRQANSEDSQPIKRKKVSIFEYLKRDTRSFDNKYARVTIETIKKLEKEKERQFIQSPRSPFQSFQSPQQKHSSRSNNMSKRSSNERKQDQGLQRKETLKIFTDGPCLDMMLAQIRIKKLKKQMEQNTQQDEFWNQENEEQKLLHQERDFWKQRQYEILKNHIMKRAEKVLSYQIDQIRSPSNKQLLNKDLENINSNDYVLDSEQCEQINLYVSSVIHALSNEKKIQTLSGSPNQGYESLVFDKLKNRKNIVIKTQFLTAQAFIKQELNDENRNSEYQESQKDGTSSNPKTKKREQKIKLQIDYFDPQPCTGNQSNHSNSVIDDLPGKLTTFSSVNSERCDSQILHVSQASLDDSKDKFQNSKNIVSNDGADFFLRNQEITNKNNTLLLQPKEKKAGQYSSKNDITATKKTEKREINDYDQTQMTKEIDIFTDHEDMYVRSVVLDRDGEQGIFSTGPCSELQNKRLQKIDKLSQIRQKLGLNKKKQSLFQGSARGGPVIPISIVRLATESDQPMIQNEISNRSRYDQIINSNALQNQEKYQQYESEQRKDILSNNNESGHGIINEEVNSQNKVTNFFNNRAKSQQQGGSLIRKLRMKNSIFQDAQKLIDIKPEQNLIAPGREGLQTALTPKRKKIQISNTEGQSAIKNPLESMQERKARNIGRATSTGSEQKLNNLVNYQDVLDLPSRQQDLTQNSMMQSGGDTEMNPFLSIQNEKQKVNSNQFSFRMRNNSISVQQNQRKYYGHMNTKKNHQINQFFKNRRLTEAKKQYGSVFQSSSQTNQNELQSRNNSQFIPNQSYMTNQSIQQDQSVPTQVPYMVKKFVSNQTSTFQSKKYTKRTTTFFYDKIPKYEKEELRIEKPNLDLLDQLEFIASQREQNFQQRTDGKIERETPLLIVNTNFDKEEELLTDSKPGNLKSSNQQSLHNISQTTESPMNPTYTLLHSKVNSGTHKRNISKTNKQSQHKFNSDIMKSEELSPSEKQNQVKLRRPLNIVASTGDGSRRSKESVNSKDSYGNTYIPKMNSTNIESINEYRMPQKFNTAGSDSEKEEPQINIICEENIVKGTKSRTTDLKSRTTDKQLPSMVLNKTKLMLSLNQTGSDKHTGTFAGDSHGSGELKDTKNLQGLINMLRLSDRIKVLIANEEKEQDTYRIIKNMKGRQQKEEVQEVKKKFVSSKKPMILREEMLKISHRI